MYVASSLGSAGGGNTIANFSARYRINYAHSTPRLLCLHHALSRCLFFYLNPDFFSNFTGFEEENSK